MEKIQTRQLVTITQTIRHLALKTKFYGVAGWNCFFFNARFQISESGIPDTYFENEALKSKTHKFNYKTKNPFFIFKVS